MEGEVFGGNRISGRSIAGSVSAAAGWSHGDRIPLSEFTEQLLRQGTGAICYQLRSQSWLSPFNAERLFGGTWAQKPACLVPLPRHPALQKGCQKYQQPLPVTLGEGPHSRETPGPMLAAQYPALAGRCRWKKRWVSLRSPLAPGKLPSAQEVGGRYQALPIPLYSLLAPPPAHPTQPSSFCLPFCAQ